MKISKILTTVLALAAALPAQAALVEGEDYVVLAKPMAQQNPEKIEVAEFFGYFCVHCYNLNPVLLKRERTWASDTYLRPIHVVWSPDMMGLARIAAAVNSTGMKKQASQAVFEAVYNQKINLADADTFKKWAEAQTAFDGKKLVAAYNGFSNPAQAQTMADLTMQHNIESTPTFIVGGKYQMRFKGTWEQNLDKVDEMIAKVRKERGMKAPAAKARPRSLGASAAKAANR
ncbi:thiol:disulfide interchange protein DsbA/DsbL [Neisseria leonii]|uniref:thiol:disulfide interchange protein DsbA/DsbL n=1 Tax=Neisseria leonii TaxID=2995413 RepID=UPI0030CE63BA